MRVTAVLRWLGCSAAAENSNAHSALLERTIITRMADPHDHSHDHFGVGDGTFSTECVEWCPICRTMDVLRASTTPEVREQWQGIQREALLTLRTLIDHYIQRLGEEQGRGKPSPDVPHRATPVEEIPIE